MRFNRVIDAAIGGAISALVIAPFTSVQAHSSADTRHPERVAAKEPYRAPVLSRALPAGR